MIRTSHGERTWIYVLVLLGVLVGGYEYLLEPQLTIAAENEAYYAELEAEKDILSGTGSENTTYEEKLAILEQMQGSISEYLEDEELDVMVTALMKENGLVVESFAINYNSDSFIDDGISAVEVKIVDVTTYGDEDEILSLIDTLYGREDIYISSLTIDTSDSVVTQYSENMGADMEGVLYITMAVYMQAEVNE